MDDDILIPAGILLIILLMIAGLIYMPAMARRNVLRRRVARVTGRALPVTLKKSSGGVLSLRRSAKGNPLPLIGNILISFASISRLRDRLERCGMTVSPDVYIAACAGIAFGCAGMAYVTQHSLGLALCAGLLSGVILPHFVVGYLGNKRNKKFLRLFPDAIDFIVRGLRSGLPVTESLNIIGMEMEEPVKGVFSSIGESVRLGMPFEKALSNMAQKMSMSEFNFFVTSIILQRETGGNLSEILSNLSDVLRKRFMMRMKIKAMSSEAKASAIIIGALPFFVIGALKMLQPAYLDPLTDDPRGRIAAAGAAFSLFLGIGIMIKMSRFEI